MSGAGMNTLEIAAVPESLPEVLDFINARLARAGCESRLMTQIDVAAEEIFVNISSYAYKPETSSAWIQVEKQGNPPSAVLRFSGQGKPYNPLEKPDPDLKLPLRERKKGGLGIYIVNQSMDTAAYEYRDGQNVLTVMKRIG